MTKKNKRTLIGILVFLLAISLIGCKSKEVEKVEDQLEEAIEVVEGDLDTKYPITVEDAFGRIVEFTEAPKKIISLAPHNTEIIYALGGQDELIGVTSYCDYPLEAQEKEVIGGFKTGDLERIIELEPDLILVYGEGDPDQNKVFTEAGIKLLGFEPETVEDIVKDMELIGSVIDKQEEAMENKDRIIKNIEEVKEVVGGQSSPKVFYEVWHDPLMAASGNTFIGQVINLAGGTNIAHDETGYDPYDMEKLVENNPEIYLAADDGLKTVEDIKARPGYEEIDAIKNNKVYLLDANILSRPGPRVDQAVEIVAKALYPDLFK